MGGAKARVRAAAKADMGVGTAVRDDLIGLGKDLGVAVCLREAQRYALARGHRDTVNRSPVAADTAQIGQRGQIADQLFRHGHGQPGFGLQTGKGCGVPCQIGNPAGDQPDHRIAPTGKDQMCHAHLFIPGQGSALEFSCTQTGKKAAGPEVGPIQTVGDVIYQPPRPFQIIAMLGAEDMQAPSDPQIGFGHRHTQKMGQRPRLQRQGKLLNDLDLAPIQRFADHPVDQRLDQGGVGRIEGLVEHVLHQRAIGGVDRRVGLDRVLAEGPGLVLGRNLDAAKGIIAELGPVARGLAQGAVALDMDDLVAVLGFARDDDPGHQWSPATVKVSPSGRVAILIWQARRLCAVAVSSNSRMFISAAVAGPSAASPGAQRWTWQVPQAQAPPHSPMIPAIPALRAASITVPLWR